MICGIGVRLPSIADGVDERTGEAREADGVGRVARGEIGAFVGVRVVRDHDRRFHLAMGSFIGVKIGVHEEN